MAQLCPLIAGFVDVTTTTVYVTTSCCSRAYSGSAVVLQLLVAATF